MQRCVNFVNMITTKVGDYGNTRLCNQEVKKSSCLVNTLGDLDEFISSMGMVRAFCEDEDLNALCKHIQHMLFDFGSDLAKNRDHKITKDYILFVERRIQRLESKSYYKDFHIPGTNKVSSLLDYARSVCRRVERTVWSAYERNNYYNRNGLVFLNRLSDLLWLLARKEGGNDPLKEYRKVIKDDDKI